jgi:long-chain fatty acid transport protein
VGQFYFVHMDRVGKGAVMKKRFAVFVLMVSLLAMASPAFSAGFALIEQGVGGLGNAYAGASAIAEDATTIFFNPAGMTRLKGQQALAALHVIMPQSEFKNAGSTLSPALGGAALSGNDGGQGGVTGLAPNLYYAANLDNGWACGLGINAPFGLSTDWNDGWVGRYHALRSEVMTVNINPSLAYRVNEHLSLGAGVSAQYVKAELSNAIDFGSIAFASSGGLAGTRQQQDGKVKLEADDWGYGYNLGLLLDITEDSRVGLSYRSRIKYTAKGDADFTVPASISGIPGGLGAGLAARFADTDVKSEITLPDSASLSYYHRLNPKWAIMADVSWTNWSTFDELRIEFDNPLMPDNVTTENWKDSWRYSLGANYHPSERMVVRAGVAYDEEPIPDAESRTPRIPGEDRLWTALGLGYRIGEQAQVDLGYAHLFVKDSKINRQAGTNPAGEDFFRGTLVGEFENSVDIISLQLAYNF